MQSNVFKLRNPYTPAGDQPAAIAALTDGVLQGARHQTLLGATGTGKTFTIANVIQNTGKTTLVIAHNKTLAAQLAAEFREFFPDNEVHYFVSYYDYYQPEAYVPVTDTYIEKEAQINEEIDRLRHAATQALLTKKDVIVVASVSAIYGLGNPGEYAKVILHLGAGTKHTRATLIRNLVSMYFERVAGDPTPGTFRALGNTVEIMPSHEQVLHRVHFNGEIISKVETLDAITREVKGEEVEIDLFPAKHFVTPDEVVDMAIADIEEELQGQLALLRRSGRELDAERLNRRTRQDIAMIKEIGYCSGIENYSRHFDRRGEGEPPHTLLSYFPKREDGSADFLTVIDESHVTIPQIAGMYAGDNARKNTLINHGFRLPSARDNRPLSFDEFEESIGEAVYVSATPGKYELTCSGSGDHQSHHASHSSSCHIVEQIIRPTGLVDPEIDVRPVVSKGRYAGQVKDFIAAADAVTKRGARSLVTVLTKKMAEDLAEFLRDTGIRAEYIHSGIKTVERIKILTQFRQGTFDVLVGVNLLREGLDLPEVELVGILDADKEGFLRSDTALIQTIGRAARNVHGRVILYAENITGSMRNALEETQRRREKQVAYNTLHGITPATIQKQVKDISDQFVKSHSKAVAKMVEMDIASVKTAAQRRKLISEKRKHMLVAARNLDFETAALLRDEVKVLEDMV
tara:strand:+ start:10666 stop:12732 length:2067 start_codon:yes stop_codon:yes gene_type:complete